MSLTIQNANFWKRISAWLFDIILTCTIALGLSIGVSAVLKYDDQVARLESRYAFFEQEYGISFDITQEEYDALTQEEKDNFDAASLALSKDAEAIKVYNALFYMTLAIISVSAFLAILIWHFLVPLFFKNGQTLGKKIFGIAVMRTNGLKVANPVLFCRTIIGLFAIETMFPLYLISSIYFGLMGIVGVVTLLLFLGLQIGVMFYTKTNSAIHDLLCDTVVVDISSQMIFDTEEEKLAYEAQLNNPPVLNSSN